MSDRIDDLERFYALIAMLEDRIGGRRLLADCTGSLEWPHRGVYFFFEDGEFRLETGSGPRVVRVGTHAVSGRVGPGTSLWTRLSQHRGSRRSGGGNHRGSIFRQIVGTALIKRAGLQLNAWDDAKPTDRTAAREQEAAMEMEVSKTIGAMSVIWLPVDDAPSRSSARADIEKNAIALLSNYNKQPLDFHSERWLGGDCNRRLVRDSGLWNQDHVDGFYDGEFLDRLERLVKG